MKKHKQGFRIGTPFVLQFYARLNAGRFSSFAKNCVLSAFRSRWQSAWSGTWSCPHKPIEKWAARPPMGSSLWIRSFGKIHPGDKVRIEIGEHMDCKASGESSERPQETLFSENALQISTDIVIHEYCLPPVQTRDLYPVDSCKTKMPFSARIRPWSMMPRRCFMLMENEPNFAFVLSNPTSLKTRSVSLLSWMSFLHSGFRHFLKLSCRI